jgi:hypothetical protein
LADTGKYSSNSSYEVDLVQHDDGLVPDLLGDEPITLAEARGGIDDEEHLIHLGQLVERRLVEVRPCRGLGLVNARRIDEHQLRTRPMQDAAGREAGRLRLVGHDRHLVADHGVQ